MEVYVESSDAMCYDTLKLDGNIAPDILDTDAKPTTDPKPTTDTTIVSTIVADIDNAVTVSKQKNELTSDTELYGITLKEIIEKEINLSSSGVV